MGKRKAGLGGRRLDAKELDGEKEGGLAEGCRAGGRLEGWKGKAGWPKAVGLGARLEGEGGWAGRRL